MRPFADYPTSWGSSRASVFPHRGPSSYTQVVAGAAPALSTGGDTVEAVEAGVKYFDAVLVAGLSDSGTYRVEVCQDTRSGIVGSNAPGASQPSATVRLRWVVVATGAQAAAELDLDAEIVRLVGIGPK